MITYNKLVRDKIIEKIENNWWVAKHHIATETEFEQKLKEKLVEEAKELLEADQENIRNELADTLKVIEELKKLYHISDEEIVEIMKKKDEKNGAFDKKIILEEASEY